MVRDIGGSLWKEEEALEKLKTSVGYVLKKYWHVDKSRNDNNSFIYLSLFKMTGNPLSISNQQNDSRVNPLPDKSLSG